MKFCCHSFFTRNIDIIICGMIDIMLYLSFVENVSLHLLPLRGDWIIFSQINIPYTDISTV